MTTLFIILYLLPIVPLYILARMVDSSVGAALFWGILWPVSCIALLYHALRDLLHI
ncbi:hypothetical protein [Hymenobacter mucosus]|uniref:Uncharacterized protein n=1 Tax=Hymenobacter mucosus TaxID=1411120 RepID=A0A239A9C4_9BACT|nr:hypothetical protein [Hymenobacter mucosus]SNR91941.1 hypothetical protein SAMN06269173_11163 [Hymenobacter mucosus]